MKRFSKNSSNRNSNKSLTLQSKSSDKALGFDEGKHGGITQRSLSMEHLNNAINLLSSTKTKDLKENGVDSHRSSNSSSMISSKTSSSDMLSLARRKKQSSSVPSTPSVLSSRDYSQYSSDRNNSSNHTKQSSGTVLTNIENTLYNQQGHNNPTIQYTSNNSLYTSSAPGVNSANYTNNTTAPTSDSVNHYEKNPTSVPNDLINSSALGGGDLKYIIVNSSSAPSDKNNSSAPSGDSKNIIFNSTSALNENYTSAPSGNKLNQEQAEARLNKLRQELDRKRIFIKNMKMSLDTVDSSDNIDIRIQHAELEYQLGKEELNLLNILEEFRNLQNSIESNNNNKSGFGGYFHERLSIYNYIVKHCTASDSLTLHAVQIPYDSKCPKFGLSYRDENNGLYVEWTSEEGGGLGLCKSDRILEINNHLIVQTNNRTELIKLLKLLPTTKLVVLRKTTKIPLSNDITNHALLPLSFTTPSNTTLLESVPQSGKIDRIADDAEKIQSDNVRLTHRISYLEEQVAELLAKVNKGQTFQSNNKITSSRTKNRYLETSLCSSEPYETKEYSSQRKLDAKYKDTRNLAVEDDDEIEVFQKGNKIKTLLKNQKYAKEKLDKVLERTRKSVGAKENGDCDEDSNNQRYNNTQRVDSEESTKENRQSLSRKYKTLEKCNPSKYHRRKKSDSSIVALNKNGTNGTNASDTETYIPKIKSKSLIYLNKSQSDYNYPLAAPPSEKTVSSLTVNGDSGSVNSDGRLSFEHAKDIDDDRYRKTYTFPIVKYNSDKNVRKIIDAKIYEENKNLGHQSLESRKSYDANLNHQSLDSRRSYDRLGEKLSDQIGNFNELNRKLNFYNNESSLRDENITAERTSEPYRKTDAKENDVVVRTSSHGTNDNMWTNHVNDIVGRKDTETQSLERHGRLYVVDEAEYALKKHNKELNNERNDTRITSNNKPKSESYPYGTQFDSNSHGTSRISIEFMDKPGHPRNNITRIGSDDRIGSKKDLDYYQNREPNNNVELYRIEKAIFNELHEECINKLDKSQSQRTLLPIVRNQSEGRIQNDKNSNEQDNGSVKSGSGKTNSVDETGEDGDEYCANQYDEFVRNKQSLDRIYDKYFQEPEHDSLGLHKDRHRYFTNKQDILKNKFKNEKYVDIDNDNEIPLSKNVEKLNNNFKEFWKIKSYKKNCASPTCQSIDKIEKSQSETNFSDYERKLLIGSGGQDQRIFPATTHEEVRKFNENTRMSKYELDDKLEKEKLQKSFLSNNHCRSKPIPPKKPARLSLQRAASLQSVNSIASVMTHNSDSQTKKPIKRNYKGDTSYLTVSLQNTGNERWC